MLSNELLKYTIRKIIEIGGNQYDIEQIVGEILDNNLKTKEEIDLYIYDYE